MKASDLEGARVKVDKNFDFIGFLCSYPGCNGLMKTPKDLCPLHKHAVRIGTPAGSECELCGIRNGPGVGCVCFMCNPCHEHSANPFLEAVDYVLKKRGLIP